VLSAIQLGDKLPTSHRASPSLAFHDIDAVPIRTGWKFHEVARAFDHHQRRCGRRFRVALGTISLECGGFFEALKCARPALVAVVFYPLGIVFNALPSLVIKILSEADNLIHFGRFAASFDDDFIMPLWFVIL